MPPVRCGLVRALKQVIQRGRYRPGPPGTGLLASLKAHTFVITDNSGDLRPAVTICAMGAHEIDAGSVIGAALDVVD